MSFHDEEESHKPLLNMDLEDIFKHENGTSSTIFVPSSNSRTKTKDSVDMLLKEINSGELAASTSFTDSLLAMASPIKPLKFPSQPNEKSDSRRDYNSSSDTYVSDNDNDVQVGSCDLEKSPLQISIAEAKQETKESLSPSKSIMKTHTSTSGSPKKQVAFQNGEDLEVLHLYTPRSDPESHKTLSEEKTPVAHAWLDIGQLTFNEEESNSHSPPAPPPHSSDTITGLLESQKNGGDDSDSYANDVDVSKLSQYRLNHKNYSNLSLNEKLGIFLNNSHFRAAQDDMDDHLERLENARKEETNVNIHNLSFQLETTHQNIENPLNALSKTENYQLRSAGSSQSSLQSLMDSNRYLEANIIGSQSQGIVFNDGIKGFLNNVADLIIPSTDKVNLSDDSSDMLTFGNPVPFQRMADGDKFHDSFDHSYNLTEKSILNLLNSASQINLVEKRDVADEDNIKNEEKEDIENEENQEGDNDQQLPIKEESGMHEFSLSPQSSDHFTQVVKMESENYTLKPEPEDSFVKRESEDPLEDVLVKQEETDTDLGPLSHSSGSKADAHLVSSLQQDPVVKHEPKGEFDERDQSFPKIDYSGENSTNNHLSEMQLPKTELQLSIETSDNIHSKEIHDVKIEGNEQLWSMKKTKENNEDSHSVTSELHDVSLQIVESKAVEVVYRDNRDLKLISPTDSDRSSPTLYGGNEVSGDNIGSPDSSYEQRVKLETVHANHKSDAKDLSRESTSDVFEDTSEELLGKTLAPPKFNDTIKRDSAPEEEENSILANSSNILPPIDIKHPSHYHRSGDNIYDSFEESLSAEHDAENKKSDFLSIWHSQQQKKKSYLKPSELSYKVLSIQSYGPLNSQDSSKIKIPSSLHPRKFKEVNLVSKRIVSPDFEDLHVSGFLPEISEDSGLEGHFKGLLGAQVNVSTAPSQLGRRKSWSSQNILSDINDPKLPEPAAPVYKRHSIHASLKPASTNATSVSGSESKKKSKFYIPPFEIKRTNSILSPRNKYNDIFDDSFTKPTIKASGMKTLPSMDRDDVKRIMHMKQAMNQEEYSNLKLMGNKKRSIVQEPQSPAHHTPQVASIHCDSLMSHLSTRQPMQHVANELFTKPMAVESKDQLFNERLSSKGITTTLVLAPKVPKTEPIKNDPFPEPDPELISLSGQSVKADLSQEPDGSTQFASNNPFLVKTGQDEKSLGDIHTPPRSPLRPIKNQPIKVNPSTPRKVEAPGSKKSPIKIHSPVKIIRKGDAVTGIVLEKENQELKTESLMNHKPRESKAHLYALSTLSVPSNTTSHDVMDESHSIMEEVKDTRKVSKSESHATSTGSSERGRLFFRVVGFKNIDLPGIKDRNGAFNIILDNGIHCIKTPNYKLDSSNVMIGKEFELTVGESLEFIVTMKATYDKPKGTLVEVSEKKVVRPKNKIRRMLGSKEIITTTKFIPKTAEDNWKNKFATDGSFARCYVDLEQYEGQILGKACNFNITCFNEWATSVQGGQVIKRQPYTIGQLEVKMLFVPRTEPYEVLPSSIKFAYERLDDLRHERKVQLEGYMHQEGGDCETWKKRWFVLKGTSLIAHSEFTHKTRASINLAKVTEVIYVDKDNAQRSSSNYRNFSDILLMENAFKIRFANGEIIDFGAANKDEKLQWIKAIQEIVYRNKFRQQPWVKLMQRRNGHVLALAQRM